MQVRLVAAVLRLVFRHIRLALNFLSREEYMKKIIFTEKSKQYIQNQLNKLDASHTTNIVDLELLIEQTKQEEQKAHEAYYHIKPNDKNVYL